MELWHFISPNDLYFCKSNPAEIIFLELTHFLVVRDILNCDDRPVLLAFVPDRDIWL